MTKETAQKVADLLGLVENSLKAGRPRKPPGRPRPEATDLRGVPVRLDKAQFWTLDKISTPAAFRLAAKEQGYSPYIVRVASEEFRWTAGYFHGSEKAYAPLSLAEIDAIELDTRNLIRAAHKARTWIERAYLKGQ